jgi:hypothetical protein
MPSATTSGEFVRLAGGRMAAMARRAAARPIKMTDQHHLLRAIRDVARMIEKVEPVVADAALAHLFAGTIARMADKEEYLNPTSQARISMLRRSANRQRRHPAATLVEQVQWAAHKEVALTRI